MSLQQQFRQPIGWLGALAGWIMANRPSNRQRNRWTVKLLNIQSRDHILEIGCGPGLALQLCQKQARQGFVMGLDHSGVMVNQAKRRNPQLTILQGSLQNLPTLLPPTQLFDKIFAINVVQFMDDLNLFYRQIHNFSKPGGIVATTYQPRHAKANRQDALDMAEKITMAMRQAGFSNMKVEELPLQPLPAMCVRGEKHV